MVAYIFGYEVRTGGDDMDIGIVCWRGRSCGVREIIVIPLGMCHCVARDVKMVMMKF